MEILNFATDGSSTEGRATESNSGKKWITLPYGIAVMALKQVSSGTVANDADWNLWIRYKDTGQKLIAESLDPTNDGGIKLGPSGITIAPDTPISFYWSGQAVAADNTLQVYYERA